MTCEGKPETTAYDRLLAGHEVPRLAVEKSFRFAKGDISGFEKQARLEERLEGGEKLIRLKPKVDNQQLNADNLR